VNWSEGETFRRNWPSRLSNLRSIVFDAILHKTTVSPGEMFDTGKKFDTGGLTYVGRRKNVDASMVTVFRTVSNPADKAYTRQSSGW